MVKKFAALVLLLSACSPSEGTVLLVRDAGAAELDAEQGEAPEAAPEAEAGLAADAADMLLPEAGLDAGPGPRGACRIEGAKDGFYDSFTSSALRTENWLVAHGPVQFGGQRALGGFAQGNVSIDSGALLLRVRGDRYEGAVRSVDGSGRALASGKRSAAAVATRDLFASGTYQVEGHFAGPPGLKVALWFVRDDESMGAIDMSVPGTGGGQPSYAHVHLRSRDASSSSENQFALSPALDDGAAHILRFDWYTTVDNAVSFWVDDMPRWQTGRSLPSGRAARLWIVAWVPDDAPADFDTADVRIENAFITPFGNSGDRCSDFELAGPFLREP
jgi:hypothetical protein